MKEIGNYSFYIHGVIKLIEIVLFNYIEPYIDAIWN